ncbi:MAG: class I SAM-dependent methyltransferase [Ginsengibacter sp.]
MPALNLYTNAKKILKILVFRLGYGSRVSKIIWEKQFNNGSWDYLEGKDEVLHYQTIIQLYDRQKNKNSTLDIGCGKGVLYKYLKESNSFRGNNYVGLDLSETAINAATARFPGIKFHQGDFENENLDEKFDIIIFNESLYYFHRPLIIIENCFAQNLFDNGVIIISMFDLIGHDEIWKRIEKHYQIVDEEEVMNDKGEKWKIKVIKK